MGSKVKGVKKSNKPTRGKAPGGRVYEVAQAILSAPEGGVAAVIRAALNDKEAPIRRDPRAFTMFSTRCRKKGEWAKCVEIFDAMRDQGIETNTIVHNATMSACSKGGDWERALELFDAMPGEGHERSTITYNVAMGACMRGGDWERGDARGFGLEFLAIAPLTEEKRHEGFGRPQLVTSFPRTTQTARASLSVSRTPRSSTRAPPRFL